MNRDTANRVNELMKEKEGCMHMIQALGKVTLVPAKVKDRVEKSMHEYMKEIDDMIAEL